MISNNVDMFVFGQNFMPPMNGSLTKMKGIPMTHGLFLEVQPTETILISDIMVKLMISQKFLNTGMPGSASPDFFKEAIYFPT